MNWFTGKPFCKPILFEYKIAVFLMRKITIILFFCLFHVAGNSQIYIEGTATTGVMIQRNFRGSASLLKERPYACGLSVSQQTDSCQTWASFFNYPRYGVEFLFVSPGNPENIGRVYSLISHMRFSLLRKNYLLNPGFRIGLGVGYVTKPFDPNTNYKNIILSSHWNAAVALSLDVEARLFGSRLLLRSGVGLTHFSNGATKIPNFGMNIFTGSVTASYALSEKKLFPCKYTPDKPEPDRRINIDVFLLGGRKESWDLFDGEKYGVAALSAEASYRYARQLRIGVCADLLYDSSKRMEILKTDSVSIAHWKTLKPGLALSHEFLFGRLSAFLQYGVYIHLNKYDDRATYQRLALRYALTDRFRLHLGLKSHKTRADCIEFGLGVRVF